MRCISVAARVGKQSTLPPVLAEALPFRVRDVLREFDGRVEEIRLRRGRQMSVTSGGENLFFSVVTDGEELEAVLRKLSGGSLYAYEDSIREGFLSLAGGVRVGVSGRASVSGGRITGISEVTGLCIRMPAIGVRATSGSVVRRILDAGAWCAGVLILAPPGEGKTTLLRSVALACASQVPQKRTVVVDTREEFDLPEDRSACALDILRGYPKADGIAVATRTLNAQVIVCDEIGEEETRAILSAANCGVPLVASAHAADVRGLLTRPGFRELHRARVFGTYLGIQRGGPSGFVCQKTDWEAADAIQGNR